MNGRREPIRVLFDRDRVPCTIRRMKPRPSLETPRLILRPFRLDDAAEVERLASAREIAANTLNIPHPYDQAMALAWIAGQQSAFERGRTVLFAITLREDGRLVGAIGCELDLPNHSAELGFWIGVPYWGRGYCTEAARVVLSYGFDVLKLNRVHASHFSRNPASGRVMQKIGMVHEGCLRQHVLKWGKFENLEKYGILADEFSP